MLATGAKDIDNVLWAPVSTRKDNSGNGGLIAQGGYHLFAEQADRALCFFG